MKSVEGKDFFRVTRSTSELTVGLLPQPMI